MYSFTYTMVSFLSNLNTFKYMQRTILTHLWYSFQVLHVLNKIVHSQLDLHFTWLLPAHQAPRILHPHSSTPHISTRAGPHIRGKHSLLTAIGDL